MRYTAAIGSFLLGSAFLFTALETHGPPRSSSAESPAAAEPSPTVEPERILVMAFIDTSEPETSGANRSQALVVRSLHDQYREKGIHVIVVQSSADPQAGRDPQEQLNARYDWGLADMTILPDLDGRLAAGYDVREFPTTMVIGRLGKPVAVWEGYSPPGVLGPALNRLSNAPLPFDR